MDLFCPKCGEPIENDMIHDRVEELKLAPSYYLEEHDPFSQRERNPEYSSEVAQAAYRKLAAEFRTKGCPVLGLTCSPVVSESQKMRSSAAAAMYDLLGDDMDGAAAMLEDADMLGYFDD